MSISKTVIVPDVIGKPLDEAVNDIEGSRTTVFSRAERDDCQGSDAKAGG